MKKIILILLLTAIFLSGCGLSGGNPKNDIIISETISEHSETPIPDNNVLTQETPVPENNTPAYSLVGQSFDVSCNYTPYYSSPTSELSSKIGELSTGTTVIFISEVGDFYQVRLDSSLIVWIDKWFLNPTDTALRQQLEIEALSVLTSSPTFIPSQNQSSYTVTCTTLNCRAVPANNCKIYTQVYFGDQVTVLGQDGDFYLCKLRSGGLAYCNAAYLTSEPMYAVVENGVDLRAYLPNAQFELLFASSNNITGSAMYPAVPLLEKHTAELLKRAYDIFEADGYILKIYDAYRPASAQKKLWNIVQDSNYIADPNRGGSWHQSGRAVDISLVDAATGIELEMPSPMHTFGPSASRDGHNKWTDEVKHNVDYMTRVMQSVGFGIIGSEWWHFEYTANGKRLDPEINYSSLTYYSASQYPYT